MKIEIKKVKLSDVKINPDNPRRISEKDMAKLVKSIKEFPEMLNIREVVVDESMTVLGGNMRVLALREAGASECTAKIVKGLTPKQKREFIIKDNGSMGEWDFDALANTWGELPLADWGIRLPEDWLKGSDEILEQSGMNKGGLSGRFGIPPFSVFNAREGWWQDRKRAWLALGIQSELGRGENASPGGAPRPACDYSKNQRGDGRGRPLK